MCAGNEGWEGRWPDLFIPLCQSGLRGLGDWFPTEETTEPKSGREGGGRKVNRYMKGLGV